MSLMGIWKPSKYGSRITWGSETKSIWFRNYLGVGNQVNMVPELPWGRKPSQYGPGINWGSETKSIWFRNYLGVGNQVNMVPELPGGRKPSQYGSGITFTDRVGPFFESLIVVTVGWGPTVISGKGHQNQRGSKGWGKGMEVLIEGN